MYWAVTEFGACAGIEVTASHNPDQLQWHENREVAVAPLDDADDFQVIKALAGSQEWSSGAEVGKELDRSERRARPMLIVSSVSLMSKPCGL
jgi:phosphomannomutase